MKDIKMFEEMIEKLEEIEELEDMTERRKARAELVENMGADNLRVFRFYTEAKYRDNDYVDFDDCDEKDVPIFLGQLRRVGIDKITVSSSWSGCPSLMFEFVKNGCTIEGMVEVNRGTRIFDTDEFEKKPAFLLSI